MTTSRCWQKSPHSFANTVRFPEFSSRTQAGKQVLNALGKVVVQLRMATAAGQLSLPARSHLAAQKTNSGRFRLNFRSERSLKYSRHLRPEHAALFRPDFDWPNSISPTVTWGIVSYRRS